MGAMLYLAIAWMLAHAAVDHRASRLTFWPAIKLSWRVAHQQFLPLLLGLAPFFPGLVYIAGFLALCMGR